LAVIALNCNFILAQVTVRKAVVNDGGVRVVGGGGLVTSRAIGANLVAPGLGYGLEYDLGYGTGGLALGGLRTLGIAAAPAVSLAPAGIALGGLQTLGYGYGVAPAYGVAVAQPAGLALGRIGLSGISGISGLALRQRAVAAQSVGPVVAAVETTRSAQVVDVPTSQDVITPQTLIIEPNVLPVNIEFRSQSSPVNVNQVHIPGRPAEVQSTRSEEEPDRLLHEVVKPVIQEVRETIAPFRRITQEILPVQEEINSVVARGQQERVIAQPQVAVAQSVAPAVAVAAQPTIAVAAQPAVAAVGVQPVGVAVAAPAVQTIGIGQLAVAQPVATGYYGTGLLGGGLIGGGLIGTQTLGAPIQTINTGITRVGAGLIGGRVNGRIINGGVLRSL